MAKILTQAKINLLAAEVLFPEGEPGITALIIFDWFLTCAIIGAKKKDRLVEEDGTMYINIHWQKIKEGIKQLGLGTRGGIFNHVRKLVDAGLLQAHPENVRLQKAYYALGELAEAYTQFDASNAQAYIDYIERKKAEVCNEGDADFDAETPTKICKGLEQKNPIKKFIGGAKSEEKAPEPVQNFVQLIALDNSSNLYSSKKQILAHEKPENSPATLTPEKQVAVVAAAEPQPVQAVALAQQQAPSPAQVWAADFVQRLREKVGSLAIAKTAFQHAKDNVKRYVDGLEMGMQAAAPVAAKIAKADALTESIAESLATYYADKCEDLYRTGNAGKLNTSQHSLQVMLVELHKLDEEYAQTVIGNATLSKWQSPIGDTAQLQRNYAAHVAQQTRKEQQQRRSVSVGTGNQKTETLSEAELAAIQSHTRRNGINKHSTGASRQQHLATIFKTIYGARNNYEHFDGTEEQAQETPLFCAIRNEFNRVIGL